METAVEANPPSKTTDRALSRGDPCSARQVLMNRITRIVFLWGAIGQMASAFNVNDLLLGSIQTLLALAMLAIREWVPPNAGHKHGEPEPQL
jgi:hypothetical protein